IRYGEWLQGPNWISRATLAALKGKPNEIPQPWPGILKSLKTSPAELVGASRALWLASQQAMEQAGALAHFDHNPRNCFLDRRTRMQLRIFDFDYITTADPAYD